MTYSVYLVQSGENKNAPTKIGVTKNIESRLRQMQTGNPYPLHCCALIPCEDRREAYKLEAYLHYRLRKRNVRNEWFHLKGQHLKPLLEAFNESHDSSCKVAKGRVSVDLKREVDRLTMENRRLKEILAREN